MNDRNPSVRLVDIPGETGRTTVALIGSLAARLAVLNTVTGGDAIGSLTAGYAALGRHVAATSEGAQLKAAIESCRAGANGEAIWDRLLMRQWASSYPPTPVLQELRNDLALLAAEDIDAVLALPLAPTESMGADESAKPAPSSFSEYLLGMWAFAREVVRGVEALTTLTFHGQPPTDKPAADGQDDGLDGPLLR
jgi:hypothetical protein